MPAKDLKFRPARPSDVDQLTELALRSKAYWGYDSDFIQRCRAELTVTQAQVNNPDNHYWLVEEGDCLLGYAALVPSEQGNIELDALFVEPDYIGQGIGKALFQQVVGIAQQQGVQRLEIQGDPNASDFYLARGCEPAGERASASILGRKLPLWHYHLNPSLKS